MSKTYKMNDIKRRNSSRNLLKVVPIQAMQSHQELARKTTDNLISIRKQFGAASPQYLRAAGRAQIAKMTAPAQIKKMMQMNGQQASTKQKELRKIRLQYGAGSPEYTAGILKLHKVSVLIPSQHKGKSRRQTQQLKQHQQLFRTKITWCAKLNLNLREKPRKAKMQMKNFSKRNRKLK